MSRGSGGDGGSGSGFGLGSGLGDFPAELGELRFDGYLPGGEVDALPAQGECFAPAQAEVGDKVEGGVVLVVPGVGEDGSGVFGGPDP